MTGSRNTKEFEARKRELEQEERLCTDRYRHHAAEAAKYERELAVIQGQLKENARHLDQLVQAKAATPEIAERMVPMRPSPYQRFRIEGPTVVIVRLLHEFQGGLSLFELQARNGTAIRSRMIKKIVGRLIESGCARRAGDKVLLTDDGIRLWEGSPLFVSRERQGQGHTARSKPNIRLARSDAMPAE